MSMTLRRKTLLIVGLSLAVLFFIVYLVVSLISMAGFSTVESQDARQNVSRAQQALDDEISKLSTSVGDWAPWDDSYNFMLDQNRDFIDSNLSGDALANLKINLMVFVDNDHQIFYGVGYDLVQGQEAPLPEDLGVYLNQNPLLVTHADTT